MFYRTKRLLEVLAGERPRVDGRSPGYSARLYEPGGSAYGFTVCDVFGGYYGIGGEEEIGAVEELACVFSVVVSPTSFLCFDGLGCLLMILI